MLDSRRPAVLQGAPGPAIAFQGSQGVSGAGDGGGGGLGGTGAPGVAGGEWVGAPAKEGGRDGTRHPGRGRGARSAPGRSPRDGAGGSRAAPRGGAAALRGMERLGGGAALTAGPCRQCLTVPGGPGTAPRLFAFFLSRCSRDEPQASFECVRLAVPR